MRDGRRRPHLASAINQAYPISSQRPLLTRRCTVPLRGSCRVPAPSPYSIWALILRTTSPRTTSPRTAKTRMLKTRRRLRQSSMTSGARRSYWRRSRPSASPSRSCRPKERTHPTHPSRVIRRSRLVAHSVKTSVRSCRQLLHTYVPLVRQILVQPPIQQKHGGSVGQTFSICRSFHRAYIHQQYFNGPWEHRRNG